jgi:hypothetical protein
MIGWGTPIFQETSIYGLPLLGFYGEDGDTVEIGISWLMVGKPMPWSVILVDFSRKEMVIPYKS